MRLKLYPAPICIVLLLTASPGRAQVVPDSALSDSLETAALSQADTLVASDSTLDEPAAEALSLPVAPAAASEIEAPVTYSAEDSMRVRLAPGDSLREDESPSGDQIELFGNVEARYEDATITSGYMAYVFAREELRASTLVKGDTSGFPYFQQGDEGFTGESFTYSLASGRGRIVGAETQVEEGRLLAAAIKQESPHVVYAQDGIYTTCELDHPHYYVKAERMKVVDGETVYTGTVQLYLLGVPMPILLPFGYFPTTEGRRSGPLAVDYGQSTDFGLYLRNLGWYFALSDYYDALIRTQIGTTGSVQAEVVFNYAKRYAFNGRLSLGYGRIRRGESTDPDFLVTSPVRVGWSHNQTFPAGQRLTASVDLQSTSQRFVSDQLEDQVRQSTTSRINYVQNWSSVGRSLSATLAANQNLGTGSASLTLPTLAFNQQRLFPLDNDDGVANWYERIGISYSGSLDNRFLFPDSSQRLDRSVSWTEALFSGEAYRRATGETQRFQISASHRVPVSANFTFTQNPFTGGPMRLTLTPSVTYTENWYDREQVQFFDADSVLERETDAGFTTVRRINASLQASTEIYGTFPWRIGRMDGFRHVVRPRIGFTYEPDYESFGYIKTIVDPRTGEDVRYSIAPGVPLRPTQTLSFSLENALLTRIVESDSTGERRRTQQLLNVNVSSGYNFAVEEHPIQDLSLRANSQIGSFRLNLNGTFSPYVADSLGRPTNETLLGAGAGFLRATRLQFNASTSIRAGTATGESDLRPIGQAPSPIRDFDPTRPDYYTPRLGYADFSAPFSASFDLSATYTPSPVEGRSEWSAILSMRQFNLRLTPNWSISGSTGFDLLNQEITTTQFALRRELDCFEMQFQIVPFGRFRRFGFSIYVKSGYLRDLLRLDLPSSDSRSAFQNVLRP